MKMTNKELIQSLAKKNWSIQGFNACMNYISLGPWSALKDMRENLGFGYTDIVFLFDKDYLEFFYLEDDFEHVGNTFLQRCLQDKNYFSTVLAKEYAAYEKHAILFTKIAQKINRFRRGEIELSKEDVVTLHHEAFESYHSQIAIGHVIEGLTFVLEKRITDALMRELTIDKKKAVQLMNDLTQPIRPSFIADEHLALLQIEKEIKKDAELVAQFKTKSISELLELLPIEIRNEFEDHAEQFYYYKLNYYHVSSLSVQDYLSVIKENILVGIDTFQQILEEKNRYEENKKQREVLLAKHILSEETRFLLDLSLETLHWQDDRKMYILKGVHCLAQTLELVSESFEIDLELLKRLDPTEISVEALETIDRNDLLRRAEHMLVRYYYDEESKETKLEVFSEDDRKAFIAAREKLIGHIDDLHGLSASSGKAVGMVRVCKTVEDLSEFKPGEILVASMTRPEYVSAMKKATAIVTDEGGITCHAAIVSRELGIPCVIGTKVATKVLKDGMQVEVRANHGLVRVL